MKVQNIVVHKVEDADSALTINKMNELYVGVVERRLNQSTLTVKQKLWVVEQIIATIKSHDIDGIIG